jgi:hypothetical protein
VPEYAEAFGDALNDLMTKHWPDRKQEISPASAVAEYVCLGRGFLRRCCSAET